MAVITLIPSKIGDVRSYYKRVRQINDSTGEVVYDNTINSNRGVNYSDDAYAIAGTRNASQTTMGYGDTTQYTYTCWQQRLLVAFDLSQVEGTITAAKLRLYPATTDYNGILKDFTIRRNTGAWDPSSVTWNNQPDTTEAGGKTAQFPSQKWAEVDVTAMILADSGNYGFKIYNDTLANFARWFVKTGSLVPQLVVTYTPYNSKIKSCTSSVPIDGSTQGTITIEQYNSAYSHKLQIKLGSQTQTFSGVGTSKSFSLPTSWLSQVPSASSGTATITLWTYDSNGNQVGSTATATFAATVPDTIVPTVSAAVELVNSNSIVAQWGILLQTYSQIKMTATGSAGAGASIASYTFSGAGMAQTGSGNVCTGGVIQDSGTLSAAVKLTDSRGRTATAIVSVTVYPYNAPEISGVTLWRCTQAGSKDEVGGTYLRIAGSYSIASCNGSNTQTVTIAYRQTGATDWMTCVSSAQSGTAYLFGGGNIDITKSYDVRIVSTDALGNTTTLLLVANQVIAALSLGLGNDRARFGGPVRMAGLEVDWDVQLNGDRNRIGDHDILHSGMGGAANGVATLDGNGRVTATQTVSQFVNITASRSLTADDNGKLLIARDANITITVNNNLPVGMEVEILRYHDNTVTFAAASGAQIVSANSAKTIATKYGCAVLKRIGSATWLLAGDLA